jgi:hypothetical protein
MKIQSPRPSKLIKSALISLGAILAVLLLKTLFPAEDFTTLQAVVLTGVSGFIINTMQESYRE